MKKRLYLSALLVGLHLASPAQTLTPAQLQRDFALFRRALTEAHPGFYRYTPKPVFDAKFDSVQALLGRPMTRQEFYVTMTPLVAALRCGHTKWMAVGREEKYPFDSTVLFPLHLYFAGEQAWVRGNYGRRDVAAGAEIVSVNGVPTAALIRQLLPRLTFADGSTTTAKYEDLNRYFPGLYATFVGASDGYEVVYRTPEGERRAVLPAVGLADIHAYGEKHRPAAQKPARLQFLDDQTALLTIDRFWIDKRSRTFPLSSRKRSGN